MPTPEQTNHMSETANSAEKITELPAVARNIHLPCKKCEVDRYHIVVAHTSATSAKVKCEVCGSTKTFKVSKTQTRAASSTAAKAKSGARKVGARKASGPDSATIWNELKVQIGTDSILPYNMKSKFQLANAINHPKFGIGFVTGATVDKIEVAFEDTGRSLVHNRS